LVSSKVPVKRFMRTDVVTISSDAPIREAVKTMYEKNVGSLVIVDDNEIKGIVTERDITRSLFIYNISNDAKIKDAYNTPLVSVDPDSSILDVAEIINKTQILRIPVVKDGKLLGVISSSDLTVLFTMFEKEEIEKKFGPYVSEL
jgi:CBS domain-containing protein